MGEAAKTLSAGGTGGGRAPPSSHSARLLTSSKAASSRPFLSFKGQGRHPRSRHSDQMNVSRLDGGERSVADATRHMEIRDVAQSLLIDYEDVDSSLQPPYPYCSSTP